MQVKLFTKSSNRELAIKVSAAMRHLATARVHPEVIDTDTPEGVSQQGLYGVMSYPSVVVTRDDGQEVASWHGRIPPVDEIRHAMGHL